ncbi:uncharacterized protein LOC135077495 [Ostrinia nubilalis]|uniref:uncharacterized protein LOC135077495 n=1 Tax=Ostrinia nubilalis TaxID=29057 RepID=UPI0030825EAC
MIHQGTIITHTSLLLEINKSYIKQTTKYSWCDMIQKSQQKKGTEQPYLELRDPTHGRDHCHILPGISSFITGYIIIINLIALGRHRYNLILFIEMLCYNLSFEIN